MRFRELFSLYGLAALFPATRLLHRRVEQLELETQMRERELEEERHRLDAEREKQESKYLELQERVFVRKENLHPVGVEQKPIKIPKPAASRIRERLRKAQQLEHAYYNQLAEAASPDNSQ